ncbi:MAG TPA: GldG family protein [Chloroflexia bacterium]|nr:GldG family protein [Chloroflexia bacterium]
MSTSNRSLIATIFGFVALGLAAMGIIYWAVFTTPSFNLNIGQWDLLLRILMVGAILAFSVYLILAPQSVGAAAAKRSNRLTANALLLTVIAIGIGIAINVIFDNVSTVRADLTAGKDFTLSDQTVKVLSDLDAKNANVTAYGFYSAYEQSSVDPQQLEDLLKEYKAHTGHFSYQIVDPVNSPAKATALGYNNTPGSIVLDSGQKRETADSATEADLTSALVRLFQNKTYSVGFLTGHGERDPNGFDQNGFSTIKDDLVKDNYGFVAVNLVTSPTLTTSDVDVLVIAAPDQPLSANEAQSLQQYIDGGGHVMMLLDPGMSPEAMKPFDDILAKYGVTTVPGVVLDLAKSYSAQEPSVVLVNTYTDTSITHDLNRKQLVTLFPLVMGLTVPTSTVGSMVVTPLVQSSAGENASWLETDLSAQQASFDPATDIPGPVTMGLQIGASTTTTDTTVPNTRLVVFGDADFGSNLALQLAPSNVDLFSNAVSWLAGQDQLVSIRAKDPAAPRTMVLDAGQKNLLAILSVFALPLIVLILGGYNWWRRR